MPIKERILKELANGDKTFKQLKIKFKASKKFFSAMDELYDNGLIKEYKGKITLVKKDNAKVNKKAPVKNNDNLINGKIVKLTENYGFIRVEGMDKDVFVAGKFMMGSVVGDEVNFKKIPSERRDFEGEVVEITHEKKNLIATVTIINGEKMVTLKDCPTLTLKVDNRNNQINNGDIVLVNLKNRGKGHRSLVATITENLGLVNNSEKAVDLLLAEKNIAVNFDHGEIQEAKKVIALTDFDAEIANRKDLRDEIIFTIDSAKTKDIDDAISIEKTKSGYVLGVHIADVSFYVRKDSLCDKTAFEKGTSIYYGQSVIPMLPKEYSNNVCSLNEKVDRLAFTCEIMLDNNANVVDYQFYKSVIHSRIKGVYSEINDIFNEKASQDTLKKYNKVIPSLNTGKELYEKLIIKRNQRGSMNIESDEAYIIFDENNIAVGIEKRTRDISEMMIEEFMLLANSCSANFAKKNNLPFLYRIHEEPSADKLDNFKQNLSRFGLKIVEDKNITLQQQLSKLLDEARDTNLQQFIHMGVLRAQSKARYSTNPVGHFGLGLSDYSHFTSPIRRYPDLAIHRILSDAVSGLSAEKVNKKFKTFANAAADQSSKAEIVAMQVERDATDIYKAEVMKNDIGKNYAGVVSSITNFGIYVTLENTVEGLVHVSKLDMVNPILTEGYSLICPVTGKKYIIGDKIKIYVENVDILNGNIDFALKPYKAGNTVKKTFSKPKPKNNKKRR